MGHYLKSERMRLNNFADGHAKYLPTYFECFIVGWYWQIRR
jgi:hypothetical protein